MKTQYTKDELKKLLQDKVNELGSQKAFAEQHGISPQYVNDVLRGYRIAGAKIQQALGAREIIIYEIENNS